MTELHELRPRRLPDAAPGLLTATGIAAAFGAAACCGLPLVLASAGLGTAWLGSVSLVASPYRIPLLVMAAVGLVAGAALLWRQQQRARACLPGTPCASPLIRFLTLAGLIAGFVLLWLGYSYA